MHKPVLVAAALAAALPGAAAWSAGLSLHPRAGAAVTFEPRLRATGRLSAASAHCPRSATKLSAVATRASLFGGVDMEVRPGRARLRLTGIGGAVLVVPSVCDLRRTRLQLGPESTGVECILSARIAAMCGARFSALHLKFLVQYHVLRSIRS
jgi:hypothetical protein